jgi:hypothetical protein
VVGGEFGFRIEPYNFYSKKFRTNNDVFRKNF